jgi:hypothetical protein
MNAVLIATLGRARTKLELSSQTVVRAEEMAARDAADVTRKEAAVATAQTESAKRLADLLTSNDPFAALEVGSAGLAPAESLLTIARSRAAVSAKALASIREAHTKAKAELQAAELAVEEAAIRIYVAQVEAVAREATEHRAKAEAALERVRYATGDYDQFGHGINGKLYRALKGSRVIETAGAPPAPPERPASEWGPMPVSETAAGKRAIAGRQPWEQLLASLLSGDSTKADDSKAA